MVKVNNVSHIIYPVSDKDKSVNFLTNVLGGFIQPRGQATYVGFGDFLLELVPAEQHHAQMLYAVGIAVEDLDAALSELQSMGVEIVRPVWNARTFWGRQAIIKDPGGPNIALRQWRAPDGPHFMGWHQEE